MRDWIYYLSRLYLAALLRLGVPTEEACKIIALSYNKVIIKDISITIATSKEKSWIPTRSMIGRLNLCLRKNDMTLAMHI